MHWKINLSYLNRNDKRLVLFLKFKRLTYIKHEFLRLKTKVEKAVQIFDNRPK